MCYVQFAVTTLVASLRACLASLGRAYACMHMFEVDENQSWCADSLGRTSIKGRNEIPPYIYMYYICICTYIYIYIYVYKNHIYMSIYIYIYAYLIYKGDPGVGALRSLVSSMVRTLGTKRAPFSGFTIETSGIDISGTAP